MPRLVHKWSGKLNTGKVRRSSMHKPRLHASRSWDVKKLELEDAGRRRETEAEADRRAINHLFSFVSCFWSWCSL
jgi:hypothetical protein